MYLVAIKSFYPKIERGKVAVIIDRNMPQTLRDTLAHHVEGIEFVILEDILTEPCQRGGTWERLLYCLDRSETEFTIQLDCDVLTVGDDMPELMACLVRNRAFTMSDGFRLDTLEKVSAVAAVTRSEHICIATERELDKLPDPTNRRYIRGSSGLAGFAKGGYTRAGVSEFHRDMERLLGVARWREWGTEQCGSNFSIANSPDPLILPYPEYSSFITRVLRHKVKLFHFIGSDRYTDGYYARRCQEVIATLFSGAAPPPPDLIPTATGDDGLPLLFTRSLTPNSSIRYLWWKLRGQGRSIAVQMRARREFADNPAAGPKFVLRDTRTHRGDLGVAYEIFVHLFYLPAIWIPPERVKLIVDLGPMSACHAFGGSRTTGPRRCSPSSRIRAMPHRRAPISP